MFTGIIESLGKLLKIENSGTNKKFVIESPISHQLKIDQSVSHDGVCLTVVETLNNTHSVIAINETLQKSTLKNWSVGQNINLERAMILGSRLDGHIVQGHIDSTISCKSVVEIGGSFEITFEYNKEFSPLIIEKGSICINGVSLTLHGIEDLIFKVSIIPYTWSNPNFQNIKSGDTLNVEYDIIGKYLTRWKQLS